nr:hypothetical protein [Tanacetum cinerariifolium]
YQRKEGELGRHAEQDNEKPDDGQRLLKHSRERIRHRDFDLVHIVGEARHQVAFALVGEVTELQVKDAVVERVAQVLYHAGAHLGQQPPAPIAENVAEKHRDDNDAAHESQRPLLAPLQHNTVEVEIENILDVVNIER